MNKNVRFALEVRKFKKFINIYYYDIQIDNIIKNNKNLQAVKLSKLINKLK